MRHFTLKLKFREQRKAARKRGIPWELEYWEWLEIWEESGHLHERGKQKGQYVMSRPGDKGSYSRHNVKIVLAETNNYEAARSRMRRITGNENWPLKTP